MKKAGCMKLDVCAFLQDEKTAFDVASRSMKALLQNIGAVERT